MKDNQPNPVSTDTSSSLSSEQSRVSLFWSWLWSSGGTSTRSGDALLALTRCVFGLSMALAHGLHKLPPSDRFIEVIGELGFPLAAFFAWCAGLAEAVGGLLLALGISTRLMAFFLVQTMLVAVFLQHGSDPFKKMELGLLYGTTFLLIMGVGGGRYSIDYWLSSSSK